LAAIDKLHSRFEKKAKLRRRKKPSARNTAIFSLARLAGKAAAYNRSAGILAG
jgi:hypothetical protein